MNRFFRHYYEHLCIYDYRMLEELEKEELNTDLFRREGDFIISKMDDRLRKCVSDEEVIRVPDGVRSIGYDVFNERNCPNVKHVIFPESVEGICPYAAMSPTLEEITLNNRYIYISDEAFEHCRWLRFIHHVPERCTIHVGYVAREGLSTIRIVPINVPEYEEEDLPF